jgi:hypothetical protein
MRGFGVLLSLLGIFIAGSGAGAYVSGREVAGIACMVIGVGLLGIGVMMFLADFALRLSRSSPSLLIRGKFFKMELIIQGQLSNVEDESDELEERVSVGEAAASTEG